MINLPSAGSEDVSLSEFLDDYFTESEEHLGSIRRNLHVMESFVNRDHIDAEVRDAAEVEVVDELLHALHSLKGLSAMVGINEAERAAHDMETALRDMKTSGAGPTDSVMEVLANGAGLIEQIVATHRRQKNSSVAKLVESEGETRSTSLPSVVRVDMKLLDDLMTKVGDLVISRGHVDESLRRLNAILPASAWRELQEANLQLQRQIRGLRESVLRVRMVPVAQLFERMRFAIRGLERESQKEVRLELSGETTEIDKHLVDRMMDPLLHMVRNAINHGLESAEERIASGKTREGHIQIRAWAEAETVVIELEDDGRGVDIGQIEKRAQMLGLIEPGETLDGARVFQMICSPGFSIREEVDLDAGRGVGMTVVKTTVNGLGGTVEMDTQPGKGTRFTIRVPLTLAIMQALIVYVDGQPFAVPHSPIQEVLRVETDTDIISLRDGEAPVVHLSRILGMKGKSSGAFHVFVVGTGSGAVGIAVDRIVEQREIVVRPVEDVLIHVPGIAGATELGDGRPVLILDVAAIVEAAHQSL